jgi:Fe-S-cluster containining protein
MTIREREIMDVKPCSCGTYPKFVQPDYYYTDIWLKCPKCGKETKNTGGYNYGYEIPLEQAKRDAIIEWNKENNHERL